MVLGSIGQLFAKRITRRVVVGHVGPSIGLASLGLATTWNMAAAEETTPTAGDAGPGYVVIRRYHLKPDASFAQLRN
jgi:hypothetical protein